MSDDTTRHDGGLTLPEGAALLRATPRALRGELGALTSTQLAWRSSEERWCINEVIGHLIEADERGFAGRIRQMLDLDRPHLEAWDQAAVAKSRRDWERDGHDLLSAFENIRLANVQFAEKLTVEQLARSALHPGVGEMTARDVFFEWIYHDYVHIQQIHDNVKALAWPQMGACRRFYEGET